jgi:hypothetical protein
MAVSLVALGLLLAAAPASAQPGPQPLPPSPIPLGPVPTLAHTSWPRPAYGDTLYFRKAPRRPVPGQPGQLALRPAPVSAAKPVLLRTAMMQREGRAADVEDTTEYKLQLEPPHPDRMFRLESESSLRQRMHQEARNEKESERMEFPEEQPISREAYTPRRFPGQTELAEPQYLCHRRLLFQQLNAERYDWDLGPIHPLVSAAIFYGDVVTLPYHAFTRWCEHCDCSTGYCLPGDPVPLLLYPPERSWTGALAEAGAIAAVFAIFP